MHNNIFLLIFVTHNQHRMKKNITNELLNNYDVNLIEQHLIYSFLKNRNLNFSQSNVINNVLRDFYPNNKICSSVASLEINNLKLLENYLELLIPVNDRKINGAFFTPSYITNFIVNEVQPKENDKCLDPSCGSGAFLIELVEFYTRKYNKEIKKTIVENIFGADILDYNVRRAKIILTLYALQYNEILKESDFNIYHIDSLKHKWNEQFEVIVGNPPYVKYQDLSEQNREYLVNNWQSIKNGSFNLYFAFFEMGCNLLTEDGRLGYITPNNYFTSLSGISLRQFFLSKKCLSRILDFRHKKVFEAQTYTAISFINKKKNEKILYDRIQESQTCNEFLLKANGSPNYLENLNVKKWRLLKSQEQKNIKQIETIGTPINKLYNISVGIATLKDEVFFVDSLSENNGYLIKKTENGIFYIEKEITKPVYKISNYKNQSELNSNTLRIITPYKIENNKAIPIPEKEFEVKYPKCYEYLISEKEKLENRDKGKKKFNPFYVWGRTQGITKRGKKLITPTFSKQPRFLLVSDEESYFTNGYGIFFKNENTKIFSLFESFIHPLSKEENIVLVQKILNSVVMDYYIKTTSITIQGGFPCYQKNFIEHFTIPDFSQEEINILNGLSKKEDIDSFLIEKYQLKIPLPKRLSYISIKF